jgi:hypothetical protein
VVVEETELQQQAQPVNQEVVEETELQQQAQPEHLDKVPQPHFPPAKRKRPTKGGRDCAGML